MFSLKQRRKALGQTAINPASEEGLINSAPISNISAQSLLEQQQQQQQQQRSVDQRALSKVFGMKLETGDGNAEQSGSPANDPSPSSSSTTSHSTEKQPLTTKPIDIKYFVPKNTEPEGLSQSVMISDHDYIHRQLVKRYNNMHKATKSTSQRTPLQQEIMQEPSDEEDNYDPSTDEESLAGTAAIADGLFSKSVPLLSFMSNYPRFEWSVIAPPDQEYKAKDDTYSPLHPTNADQCSSDTELQLETDKGKAPLNHGFNVNAEELVESTSEENLKEWTEVANACYGEVSAEEKKLFDSRLYAADAVTPWDRAHRIEYALERLKKNEFIHIMFKKCSVPMKVTNIAQNARFKQIQRHLHNPNILYMRYIRNTQTVFVIFRRYTEMMKAIDSMNRISISGKTIVCRPSNFAEYGKACNNELKRKLEQKQMGTSKKNGQRNRRAKKSSRRSRKSAAFKPAFTSSNNT